MSDAVFMFKNKTSVFKKNLFLIFGAHPSFGDHRSLRQKGRPTPNWLRYTTKIFAWKAEVEGEPPPRGGGGALLYQGIGLRYLLYVRIVMPSPPPDGGGRTTIPRYRLTVPTICSNSHAPPPTGGGALLFQVIGLRYLIYRYMVPSMYSNSHALPPSPPPPPPRGGGGGVRHLVTFDPC